tara:strand:+ start:8279 stop:8425 length:147 start_codon:yes stop_codon:yes gene_type:complete
MSKKENKIDEWFNDHFVVIGLDEKINKKVKKKIKKKLKKKLIKEFTTE